VVEETKDDSKFDEKIELGAAIRLI